MNELEKKFSCSNSIISVIIGAFDGVIFRHKLEKLEHFVKSDYGQPNWLFFIDTKIDGIFGGVDYQNTA